jgi:hypothetical protein
MPPAFLVPSGRYGGPVVKKPPGVPSKPEISPMENSLANKLKTETGRVKD